MKKFYLIALLFFLFFCTKSYAGYQVYDKLWLTGTFIGPLTNCDEKLKYYIEPRVKLIDDHNGFDQVRGYYGLGYQLTPTFAPYFGGAYVISENPTNEKITHENRIWEQFIWDFYKSKPFDLSDTTRLEERENTAVSPWAWRLREKVTIKVPLKCWKKRNFKVFEEVFLNLNHPSWVSNHFFAENRFFIGIETDLSKRTSYDVGYMNQYQHQNPNIMSHVLYLSYNIKS